MGAEKHRTSSSTEEDSDAMEPTVDDSSDSEDNNPQPSATVPETSSRKLKPMEHKKKRKSMDKERHLHSDELSKKPKLEPPPPTTTSRVPVMAGGGAMPELHLGAFRDLASADSSVREAAAEALGRELREVQGVYERVGGEKGKEVMGVAQMEAEEKDDGLENCAPSLRYALRRLIRGVSSSRECARQGFATGLTVVLATIPAIRVSSVMKLIVQLLEVSSSIKGQEARDGLLGRLFAFGALARSGRMAAEWISDSNTSCFEEFIRLVTSLAGKKQYLQEPAVLVILELVDKLPIEAVQSQVLEAQSMHMWFQKATSEKSPDALFLALKLQERVFLDSEILGGVLPQPFSASSFFSREHLSLLAPCFQESTFCQPRVHSLWPVLINILTPSVASQDETVMFSSSSKKNKKTKKGGSSEDLTKNIHCFTEAVIEGSLLMSSHDRKHLAFDVMLMLLPRLPAYCIHIVLSYKLVQCLMDVLSTKGTWLYNAAQHFLKELVNWVGEDTDRMVAIIVALQKHSSGRFDYITRTHTVRDLVARFKTGPACRLFVQRLIDLFVDEGGLPDELSDQSQTTDEISDKGLNEDSSLIPGSPDFLKNWVIDTLPRVLKNLKLGSQAKCSAPEDIAAFQEEKSRLQTDVMKFLAVQGLFSASLGNEVTSFELQETLKWPKTASSSSLCRTCIEQLQFVMEDAQKGDDSNLSSADLEQNDLGSCFIRLLKTLCNIPSVSLFRTLSTDDEKAFKKLQEVETRLFHEERKTEAGAAANKLRALRYLLIQLLLQVLLQPGEFSEAASELVICCRKAFSGAFEGDTLEEEDKLDGEDNGMPDMMDVLVDTLLSLLPQSSGRMCFAIEQVFRFFCNEIRDTGLLRMLNVVKKDLKPLRHQAAESDEDEEDDDEDFLGVEDAEDTSDVEAVDSTDADANMEETEEQVGLEGTEEHEEEMDDEAMFRMDSYITQFLRKSGKSGSGSATSQLMLFKLRVLSLLEIYLQRNPGKPQVFTIFSHLVRAFVNYHSAEGCKQLGERIWGILQKKILKAKEYPRDNKIELSSLLKLLDKSLKSAARARFRSVSLLANNSTFWILKIIHTRNFCESELEGVVKLFKDVLVDYFNSKKSRLKPAFVKEVIQRHPWIWLELFGFLLENGASAKSEFRQIEALDFVDNVMKSCVSIKKGEPEKDVLRKSKFLKKHLPQLSELIQQILSKLPKKQSRRASIRRFCARVFDAISGLKLNKSFLKSLKPDACSACECHLGNLFTAFKNPKVE